MKKRVLSLLAALAVIVSCLPSAAAGFVYFTAVNETVLELSDATMPFWSGGFLYVPSTLFTSRECGLSYSRNTARQTLSFWLPAQTRRALIFDLASGTVTDGEGNPTFPGAVVRGSVVFLPAASMAEYFELRYSNTKVENGYLIRISSSAAVLTDGEFADAATYQLAYRYNQYRKAEEQSGQAGTQSPSGSQSTPSGTGTQTEGKTVYLCFLVSDAERTAALLDVLDQYGAKGTFYFTEEGIAASGDLLRRMTATGHTVGLAADGAAGDAAEQLRRSNELLFRAVSGKTRLCVVTGGDDSGIPGYCRLEPRLDRSRYTLKSASNAAYLLGRISALRGGVSVWLEDTASAGGLRAFLVSAAAAGDRMRGLTETV